MESSLKFVKIFKDIIWEKIDFRIEIGNNEINVETIEDYFAVYFIKRNGIKFILIMS